MGCDREAQLLSESAWARQLDVRRQLRRQYVDVGLTEDAFEAESKRVLQQLLGGDVVDRDVDGAQSTRDFDLVVESAVVHAVEVTSVQLPAARTTRTGIERLRAKDLGLMATWDVYLHEEAPTRPIERHAPRLLNLLYAHGVAEFDDLSPPAERCSPPRSKSWHRCTSQGPCVNKVALPHSCRRLRWRQP